ncbi:hypothetical protein F0P96_15310 [Hymenobacter busanensis]|uniref:Uncharacterized protein n=1 Tax=Hymenobacter busanensis TaxID=2607656 RepID=A0A7L5A2T1_9BACT|nr:hypothetical protein [Hymenobacter busanensis]KAA9331600.1 hypothetical protein F0P96_15310 [Hymenobacter busanensis]QHJ08752.1 hypothetical protein GUY19_16245 [Hymenobacter busanensis]
MPATTAFPSRRRRSRSSSVRPWRYAAAAAVLADIVVNYWWNMAPPNGQTMGVVSARYPTMLTPAGYAFSIWGLIFLSLAAYSVWQLLEPQRRNPLPDVVAKPLVVAALASGGWVVAFSYELIGLCTILMLLTLGALIWAYGRARPLVLKGKAPVAAVWPLTLFLGWISVATVINVTLLLREWGVESPHNVTMLLCLGLIVVVVALGLFISQHFGDWLYPLVLAWGLVGIWVARHHDAADLAWVAAGGAAMLAIGGVWLAKSR